MAEVFGIAAGAAGFVSLLIQLISGIDTLRDISHRVDKAPAELASLTTELTCLKRLVEEVIAKASRTDDFVLQLCQASCEEVVKCLEKLKKKVPSESEGKGKPKLLKIFPFRHWEKDVEDLQRSIQGAKINLILANTRHSSIRLEEFILINQIHTSSPLISSSEGNLHTTLPLPPTPASPLFDKSKVDGHALAGIQSPNFSRHRNCAERQCSCSCHHTTRTSQRFWALEYTPLHVFRQPCDNKTCNFSKYGGKFSFALSQLGLRWSVIIQLHILAAPGKFLFRPTFEVERIVPYTSPGFEILWRCQNDLITLEDARDRLVELYRSDSTFKNHVNPGGKSYIEELVRAPWGGPVYNLKQYALLELFMREFGMSRGTQNGRFLARCARWIGEGPHLELLEILLELGFDATLIDTPYAQDWPQPSSPDWIAERLTPDPFFVEYQSMLLKDNQGFANMAPLHEAVLLGSFESVNEWITRSDKNERNFLGQTPMHLATSNLKHLLALVKAGHDLDAADNYGITPLMYAAAANREECLIALLEAGADPSLRDTRYQRTFIQYAAIHGHWNLILKSLCWIEDVAKKEVAENWAKHATILYFVVYPDYFGKREVSFQQLLAKCGSVDFIFDDRDKGQTNSLFHYARFVKDVEVLLEHDFLLVNHVNSNGQHALLSAAVNQCEPDVVRRLLSAGAEIDLRDNLHHTTLYYVLDKLQSTLENTMWLATDVVRILLANGADVIGRDQCRCPCSPDGCLPSTVLNHSVDDSFFSTRGPCWSLEWLSLVLEYRDTREAKTILLSFIRKAKVDEMGITHVCCSRNRSRYPSPWFQEHSMTDEDIDEILDEESDFVAVLENEMALCSAKAYETLLDDWMLQIKASLEKYCVEAIEHNKKFTRDNSAPYQTSYSVNYKNDCFTTTVSGYSNKKHPTREVTCDIARYICWMEHEYHHRSTSRLDIENSPKEDWYFRRFSWLHRLANVLEISIAEITDSLKGLLTHSIESEYGLVNVEESIKHFLQSWEIWEERRFSLVDEVETPLGR